MRTTKADRLNLARFGCTLSTKEKIVAIGWDQQQPSEAISASIVATLIYTKWPTGPLLCLAFEISPTKARPHYCFFPFDLKNKIHKNYLSHISRQRRIELRFLSGSRQIRRTHRIATHRCANLIERCATTISEVKDVPVGLYDFDRAVTEFEQRIRLTDHFQYVLTDSELQAAISLWKEKAATVAPEDRTRATHIVNDLLGAFRPQYESFGKEFLKRIPTITRSLMFCEDLHGKFENDYDGLAQFLTDVISAHPLQEDLRHLETATLLSKSIFRIKDKLKQRSDQSEEGKAEFEADVRDVLARLAGGQGPSLQALGSLLFSSTPLALGKALPAMRNLMLDFMVRVPPRC